MAARQRETEHLLEDGFVVAWDSSEIDETLREQLIEVASERIEAALSESEPGQGGAPTPAKRAQRHAAAA